MPIEAHVPSLPLFRRVIRIAEEIRPQEFKVDRLDAVSVQLYWRCYSLFQAILLLLPKRFGEEALLLARPLFTDSLRLAELAEHESRRPQLILGWMNRSIEELKGLFRHSAKIGLDKNPEQIEAKLADHQKDILSLRAKYHVSKLAKFRSEADAASRYGRGDDFWTFLLSHEIIHGSDAAFLFRRSPVKDGHMHLLAQTEDPKLLDAIGAYSALSMMMAIDATSKILGWSLPQDFSQLREQLEHIPEKHLDPASLQDDGAA